QTSDKRHTLRLLPFSRWTLDDVDPPWNEESLYKILKENGPNATLPDRPKHNENELGWVAGALDGVTGHHFTQAADDQIQSRIKPLIAALARLLKHSSQENLSALDQALRAETLLSVADAMQAQVKSNLLTNETHSSRVAVVGRYFTTKAADRESTKFGILLLELS